MGKGLDLTGQTFGELTVLEDSGQRAKDGCKIWRCSCTCGNDNYLISTSELNRKGARAKKYCNNTIHQVKDLKGQTFGSLEVIELDKTSLHNNMKIRWLCKCHNCTRPDLVSMRSNDLLMGKIHTCRCGCAISYGAQKIKEIFDTNNITYIAEKSEDGLVNPKTNIKLRFDFYLPDFNTYIEYDGEQHFYYSTGWNTKEKVIKTQFLDIIKNKYCLDNNIRLYRIPYYDLDDINTIKDISQDKYLVKQINHYNIDMSVLEEVE